jgi:hypothetical protein
MLLAVGLLKTKKGKKLKGKSCWIHEALTVVPPSEAERKK